ncbi:MAG: DUF1385 domain-containing protein [Clostridia bacterium]|nr:DUF1385 domain-containing protein [Clostridia bacterium]
MSEKKSPDMNVRPCAEGVCLTRGNDEVYAVRNERREIAVRVSTRRKTAFEIFRHIPFVRGCVRLIDGPAALLKAMKVSGRMGPLRAVGGSKVMRRVTGAFRSTPLAVNGFFNAIGLLIMLPLLLIGLPMALGVGLNAVNTPRFLINGICSVVRALALFPCVYMIARLSVMQRLCMYRTAGAKAVNALKRNENATINDIEAASVFMPMCVGVFWLLSLAVFMIVFAYLPVMAWYVEIPVRVLALFGVAAVFNEIVRLMELSESLSGRVIRGMQLLFTVEPTEPILDVARCAMEELRNCRKK